MSPMDSLLMATYSTILISEGCFFSHTPLYCKTWRWKTCLPESHCSSKLLLLFILQSLLYHLFSWFTFLSPNCYCHLQTMVISCHLFQIVCIFSTPTPSCWNIQWHQHAGVLIPYLRYPTVNFPFPVQSPTPSYYHYYFQQPRLKFLILNTRF